MAEPTPAPLPAASNEATQAPGVVDPHLQAMVEAAAASTPTLFFCDICQDNHNHTDAYPVRQCYHVYGKECIKSYVLSKLGDKALPIPCPGCVSESNPFLALIEKQDGASFGMTADEIQNWTTIEEDLKFTKLTCPECKEVTVFERNKKYWSKRVACKTKSCSHVWCRECHRPASRWGLHSCDGKAELKRLTREQGWQRCPGCKIPIQKNLGCNHMMCSAPGCRTRFCYGCGTTGKFCLCNRFIDMRTIYHYLSFGMTYKDRRR